MNPLAWIALAFAAGVAITVVVLVIASGADDWENR